MRKIFFLVVVAFSRYRRNVYFYSASLAWTPAGSCDPGCGWMVNARRWLYRFGRCHASPT